MAIEFTDVVDTLSEFYTLDEIDAWLDTPHPLLGNRTPQGLIAEGRKGDVLAVIKQLRDGV